MASAPPGGSAAGSGGGGADGSTRTAQATGAASGAGAGAGAGGGEQLTPVQMAVARHADLVSEERRVEELLRSRGAAYEQQHRGNTAWPDFRTATRELKPQPRMKQFHEPQELFVPDEAELPPDMVPKPPRGAQVKPIPPRKPPPGLTEAARTVSVDLDDLASMGLDHVAGVVGVPPDPLAAAHAGKSLYVPPPQPYTTTQKLSMVAAAAFLMYGTFTKLRPLWGRRGGAAAQALLGPRAGEGAPIFAAAKEAPRYQKFTGPAWEHMSGVVGGARPTGLSPEGYPLAQGSEAGVTGDASVVGAGSMADPSLSGGTFAGGAATPEMEALEKRMAELRARVRAARQGRNRHVSAEARARAKAVDGAGDSEADEVDHSSAAAVLGGLVRERDSGADSDASEAEAPASPKR